jgi:endonuclease-3 related protein
LIQNTNWKNVDKALATLYQATNFWPENILNLSDNKLEKAIASAGFFTRKAATLKRLATYFQKYEFDLDRCRQLSKEQLRPELLSIKGIGPETADVILMYGIQKGEFVVDTYARRLFDCLACPLPSSYQKAKELVEANVDHFTLRNYQNFHAMIVMFNQKYKLPKEFKTTFLNNYQLIITK